MTNKIGSTSLASEGAAAEETTTAAATPASGSTGPAATQTGVLDGWDPPKKRAGTELLLGNPYADSSVHAVAYDFLPSAMNAALEKLKQSYPEVDQNFALRFLQTAFSFGVQVPWMTYSHEAGHAREVSRQGGNPAIEMTGWMGGYTEFNLPAGKVLTPSELAAMSAAGVNQEQLNAAYMFQKWARNQGTSCMEAMGFLLAQTNLALYSSMTPLMEKKGAPVPSENDVRAYLDSLAQNGRKLTTGQLTAMAIAADLVSAPVWASLIGQVRYLAGGERNIEMPTFKIGDVKSTFPNTHLLLTTEGPVLGANVVLNPDKKTPVELSLEVRTDLKAAAVGVKLDDLKLAPNVSVNPFLRGTIDGGKPGMLVGAEVRADLGQGAALVGSVAYRHDDLLAGPEGRTNGVNAQVGISVPF